MPFSPTSAKRLRYRPFAQSQYLIQRVPRSPAVAVPPSPAVAVPPMPAVAVPPTLTLWPRFCSWMLAATSSAVMRLRTPEQVSPANSSIRDGAQR
jgi:hypothetical protein